MPVGRQLPFVTREALQKTRDGLTKLAETRNPNAAIPQKITRPGAVRALPREIAAAFKRVFEVEDLLRVFSEQGIDIDPGSFREYWRQVRKKKTGSDRVE
jgi:hypothetical protein